MVENYLLASHGNRILYFLQKFFSKSYQKHLYNGSILLFKIGRKNISVEMVFEGGNCPSSFYKKETFPKKSIPTKKLTSQPIYRRFNLYMIRHGLAEHNITLNPGILLKRDTGLVKKGKENLKKSIPYLPKKLKEVFSSPLLRTRETLFEVLQDKYPNINTISIIPSSSQIIAKTLKINVYPNLPHKKNIVFPKEYKIDWDSVQPMKNMMDEIIFFIRNKK
jgi:hypothetical protein